MADYQHQSGSVDESSKVFLGDGMSAIADIPSLPTSSHNNDNNNNNNNNNNANNTNTNNTNNNNNNNSAGSTNNNTSPELNTSPQNDLVPQAPQFKSALSYTEVRDYAYPDFHPLHYGVPLETEEFNDEYDDDDDVYEEDLGTYPDSYMRDGGPPWKEDSDLASPVVISHAVGDRISKEYEFSVASADEIHGRAVALFDFIPENENEAPLKEGQVIWVSYRHGQGWLVAEDPRTGETGLVPEEYVQIITGNEYLNSQSEHLNGNYTEEDDDEQQKQQDTLQLLEDEELHRQPHQQQNDIDYTEQSSSLPHGGPGASSDADDNNTQHQQPSTQSDDFSQPALNTSVLSEDPEMAKLTTSFETTKWK